MPLESCIARPVGVRQWAWLHFLQPYDGVPAEPQQRTDTLMHVLVSREQLAEIAHFVQPLLVVAHSGFHQQTRDPILHLHHLPHQQVPVAQGSAAIVNLGSMPCGTLVGSRSFFLAAPMARSIRCGRYLCGLYRVPMD